MLPRATGFFETISQRLNFKTSILETLIILLMLNLPMKLKLNSRLNFIVHV